MGKNSIARIFDCWIIRPHFRSLIVTMKFLKIYYSYIDTIHKYILNIYIHNCVSPSYPIVVLFTILRHHTCINIELVSQDVIVPVSNNRMIKSSLRDIGLHDVDPDHNSRTIRITVRKNFKVMICGVYKIPCIFITMVYLLFNMKNFSSPDMFKIIFDTTPSIVIFCLQYTWCLICLVNRVNIPLIPISKFLL